MGSRGYLLKRNVEQCADGPQDLAAKVASARSDFGYALGSSYSSYAASMYPLHPAVTRDEYLKTRDAQSAATTSVSLQQMRLFPTPSSTRDNPRSSHGPAPSSAASHSRFTSVTDRSIESRPPAVHVICAISENMARETCVASMDAGCPTTLQVTKQGNGQAYSETLAYLTILQPNEIIFSESRRRSVLAQKILEHFDLEDETPNAGIVPHATGRRLGKAATRRFRQADNNLHRDMASFAKMPAFEDERAIVKFVSRALFDQTKGAALLKAIARDDTYDPLVVEEYIILSAAHALVVYLQQALGASLAEKSLNLTINADGTNRMMIDRASLWQLELLLNAKTGKSRNSLVGTIDFTKTSVGARLLRTNIMSPPTDIGAINSRLELVDTFLASETFFNDVYEHLSRLPELDTMLANVSLVPHRAESKEGEPTNAYLRMARRGISALISIKTVLFALPSLANIIQRHLAHLEARHGSGWEEETSESGRASLLVGLGAMSSPRGAMKRNSLLRAMLQIMSEPTLAHIYEMVADTLTESTTHSKHPSARQHQECFALKDHAQSFLGIIRKTFLANVDDIYKKADEYAETYGMKVTVRYSTARGYYLAVPTSAEEELPDEFINCSRNNRSIAFTTKAVAEYNVRARECVRDIHVMTHDRIQEVLSRVRDNYDVLARLSDAIALLDMCHSFADNVTLSAKPWCRPFVMEVPTSRAGTRITSSEASTTPASTPALLIRNGRFAIATPEHATANATDPLATPFVSNDTYASIEKNFTVISGINGSGKSTYLKQIAIIVVLAHCGSYVPAEQASITIRDRLCTRIGNVDDQEHSISTFMMEMKETAFICNNATPKSLILLDELGRATSNEEGMSLAWAVAEYLLKKRAMTFFVTHYPQLTRLADTYPNVQNVHLEASIERATTNNIRYTHKVKSGACAVSTDYGVELAAACGWPTAVLATARSLESHVQTLLPRENFCDAAPTDELDSHTRAFDNILDIHRGLLDLGRSIDDLSPIEFLDALVALQNRLAPATDEELCERMCNLLLRGTDARKKSATSAEPVVNEAENSQQTPPDDAHMTFQSFDIDDGVCNKSDASTSLSDDSSQSSTSHSPSQSEKRRNSVDDDDDIVAGFL